MEVIFSAPQKIGTKVYKAGRQFVPDHVAYNRAFKDLVLSGKAQVLPRNPEQKKIQTARDAKAMQAAKASRLVARMTKSAKAAPGASSPLPDSAGPALALQKPASPISAAAPVKVAVATAPKKDGIA
jgi:hypothetical protein